MLCYFLPSNQFFQLKGEEHATIEKPPNHRLFDTNQQSPILQRRLNNQNQKNTSESSTAPIFNLTIGNDIVHRFLGSQPPQAHADLPLPLAPQPPHPAAPAPLAPAATIYDLQCPTLLHTSRLPGHDMPLAQFCTDFKLSDKVFEKLRDNGYQDARVLRFLMIDELKEMNFRLGEIAALRDAVEMWSLPRVT
jgi:hypothetical protein